MSNGPTFNQPSRGADFRDLIEYFQSNIETNQGLKMPDRFWDLKVFLGISPDTSKGRLIVIEDIPILISRFARNGGNIHLPDSTHLEFGNRQAGNVAFIFDTKERAKRFFPDERVIKFDAISFGSALVNCVSQNIGFAGYGKGRSVELSKAIIVDPARLREHLSASFDATHIDLDEVQPDDSPYHTLSDEQGDRIRELMATKDWWSSFTLSNRRHKGEDVTILEVDSRYGISPEYLKLASEQLWLEVTAFASPILVNSTRSPDLGMSRYLAN